MRHLLAGFNNRLTAGFSACIPSPSIPFRTSPVHHPGDRRLDNVVVPSFIRSFRVSNQRDSTTSTCMPVVRQRPAVSSVFKMAFSQAGKESNLRSVHLAFVSIVAAIRRVLVESAAIRCRLRERAKRRQLAVFHPVRSAESRSRIR